MGTGRHGEGRRAAFWTRLLCTSSSLKRILTKYEKNLIVLINLERYEEEPYRSDNRYSHTVAVVRVTKALNLEYFKGRINHVHETRW